MITTLFQNPIFSNVFLGNTLQQYTIALIAFVVFLIILGIFRTVILARLGKLAAITETDIDDTAVRVIKTLKPPFYIFLSFYLAFQFLTFEAVIVDQVVNVIFLLWIVYQVIIALSVLVDYMIQKKLDKDEGQNVFAYSILKKIAKLLIWLFGILFVLSNFGIDVTSLIAGLGIGGIAIALAVQNILGDLLSSFAIYFDKPFEIGDFIVVGDKKGTVEKIGIKTTRLRSPQGEEIIMANSKLTDAHIQNFKRMEERRVVFSIGVVYETSSDKLKKIPTIVKKIIESTDGARFDRVHFKSFDDSALSFEISYYVLSSEYTQYLDINQSINFAIKETFENEKIDMAYPTQTLYIQK
ncbi:mechanosensitive ion channel protein MscS [Candidatus Wolfebacteria bacterium]|nr:MAG: mechanosensitive ion channel protein MscS [Candidatus Wolfebacteria bacterium]